MCPNLLGNISLPHPAIKKSAYFVVLSLGSICTLIIRQSVMWAVWIHQTKPKQPAWGAQMRGLYFSDSSFHLSPLPPHPSISVSLIYVQVPAFLIPVPRYTFSPPTLPRPLTGASGLSLQRRVGRNGWGKGTTSWMCSGPEGRDLMMKNLLALADY